MRSSSQLTDLLRQSLVSLAPAEDLARTSGPAEGFTVCYCGCAMAEYVVTRDRGPGRGTLE
ncbi:hypothetical protein [Nocardia sp. NPDC020380]|uniref:hypothetical protein n=1 Tax=unclassified Nocardia TaxID=2637762 RepID=UPI0037B78C44